MLIELKHFEGQKEKPWYVIMNDDDRFNVEKFASEQDAHEFYQTIKNTCLPGNSKPTPKENDTPKFSEYADHYLSSYVKVVCKLHTWKYYKRIIESYLMPAWTGKTLDQISRTDIKNVILNLQQKGLSSATVGNISAVISGIFSYACEEEHIAVKPFLNRKAVFMFYRKVNLNKRGAMIAFLTQHCRYHTMNAWNDSTSYANNIKLYTIDKPADIDNNTWWQLLDITDWQEKLSDLLGDFGRKYNWQWQAGINGRSGGYVVLYQGGIQPSGYQSYCTHCGQRNYQKVPDGQTGICGRCEAKARVNYSQPHMQVFTWPGKAIDMAEDFRDWSTDQLRDRVALVQEFDRLADTIVTEYISTCRGYRIAEEEILVPKTIKVLEPVGR